MQQMHQQHEYELQSAQYAQQQLHGQLKAAKQSHLDQANLLATLAVERDQAWQEKNAAQAGLASSQEQLRQLQYQLGNQLRDSQAQIVLLQQQQAEMQQPPQQQQAATAIPRLEAELQVGTNSHRGTRVKPTEEKRERTGGAT